MINRYNLVLLAKSKMDAYNKYEISSELFLVNCQFQFHEMSNDSQYDAIANEV
jgi:vitamin B12 transporter